MLVMSSFPHDRINFLNLGYYDARIVADDSTSQTLHFFEILAPVCEKPVSRCFSSKRASPSPQRWQLPACLRATGPRQRCSRASTCWKCGELTPPVWLLAFDII